jgi:diguanylate cyclase (GGDEF)-like protein
MVHTARETNAIDVERTSLALSAAMAGHVDRIAGVASDNAFWDDAASAVYRPSPDLKFIKRAWGDSTADGTNYDGAYVLDPSLHTLIGMRRGREDRSPIEKRIGRAIAMLAHRPVEHGGGVGGIVMLPEGPALIGMAQILPTSKHSALKVSSDSRYRLLFVKLIDKALLDETAKSLMIEDLHLAPRKSPGDTAIALHDVHGHFAAWLDWQAASPGMVALKRALPSIAMALAAAILLTALIARQGARSVNELARQALMDSLSDLPNRRALRQELARRLGNRDHVALCLLDLDGFKFINDNYGHVIGDRLIIACAEMLLAMVGKTGFVARLGGDEFAFILSGSGAWQNINLLAEQVLDRMSKPFRVGERTVMIGASIGLAHGYHDKADAGELLRRADVAMYAAKRAGKMRICAFDAKLDQRQARIHLIETELRQSLANNDFRLVYQPLFDAADGSVNSVEALLRWTSPTLGEVDPADFIPVAEESGLIDPLGLYILRKACEDARGWNDVGVAVNISAAQLRNPEFPKHVRTILEETRFPAGRLELEITETYLISDPETAGQVMQGLHDLGVSIALDDFGTGYASIGFLRQFSFDKLKLDRSLVIDAENSDAARALLQASVAMARALHMEVTAEGVETYGQADLMRVVGCDQLQGWLFHKAMSSEELESMMAGSKEGMNIETRV